jgi:hypothetical protein
MLWVLSLVLAALAAAALILWTGIWLGCLLCARVLTHTLDTPVLEKVYFQFETLAKPTGAQKILKHEVKEEYLARRKLGV